MLFFSQNRSVNRVGKLKVASVDHDDGFFLFEETHRQR
jgi:hypothetical protein